MKPGVATRLRAAELVERVLGDGEHSNVMLATADDLTAENRAAIQRLVLDTLRWLPRTDAVLGVVSSRPLAKLDPIVRNGLRVGVTELHLGGAHHGVVDSTVEAVRRGGAPRAAGFVNAVLRRVTRGETPDDLPHPLAVGCPPWIFDRLAAAWGHEDAEAYLAATMLPAAIGVRMRPGAPTPAEPAVGIPGAGHVGSREEVVAAEGKLVVMDPASTAVVLAVGAGSGQAVLDVAAAPGNKTAALWDEMDGKGVLVAMDRSPHRLRIAAHRMHQMGVHAEWMLADGTRPPLRARSFDRILLDAPCTGLGTLRRRPEIKLRLDTTSPERMAAVQRRLLAAALPLLKPGGRLVYSVCTVFPEETIELAAEFGGRPPEGLPGRIWEGGLLLAPHLTGTDAMFISVMDG